MLKSIYRYILENQQHIKDYVFIQLLAFFWICIFLNDGVLYFERFNILLTSRSSILVFWVLAMIVLVVYACWLHKNGIRIQNDSSDFICLGMVH